MSRYHISLDNYDHDGQPVEALLAYGFDHVAGYFYQVYVAASDEPAEDADSWRGLSRSQFIERMDALAPNWPEEHRRSVALDLPF